MVYIVKIYKGYVRGLKMSFEEEEELDVYNGAETLLDMEEINSAEAGFMLGYAEEIEEEG